MKSWGRIAILAWLPVVCWAVACVGEDSNPLVIGAPTPGVDGALPPTDSASSSTDADATPNNGEDAGADTGKPVVVEPIAISTTFDTTCALIADGRVRCWGLNDEAQAGAATPGILDRAIEIAELPPALQVTAGDKHSCALTREHVVYCWGANDRGQLGGADAGVGPKSATPRAVVGLPSGDRVMSLSAGSGYTCALTEGGQIYCWGSNLGGGLYVPDAAEPTGVFPVTKLVVPSKPNALFGAVEARLDHTCAIETNADQIICWGNNMYGQQGRDPAAGGWEIPGAGHITGLSPVLGLGNYHTCLSDDIGLRCFGANYAGQLGRGVPYGGDPHFANVTIPGMTKGDNVAELAPGGNNTCALHADRSVSCVGNNLRGQIGNPTADGGDQLVPFKVSNLFDALAVRTGTQHVCALRAAGGPQGKKSVVCWGSNEFGQLGNDTNVNSPVPATVLDLE